MKLQETMKIIQKVEILVGKDKGKQGQINSIIKERNWVYVEGLNCKYLYRSLDPELAGNCVAEEAPLLAHQVKLVDPSDLETTEIEWRYSEEGALVRVSPRTSMIIPLPPGVDIFDDLVIPDLYEPNKVKDTKKRDLEEVTFKPKLCSFEEEIMESMGIKEDRKPAPTYWY